ncbi:MAG: hypothetical protein U0163_17060 [Gemmatimonadaceae bacterium]
MPMFLRQTGLSYEELLAFVTSRCVNPRYNGQGFLTRTGISLEEITAFIQEVVTRRIRRHWINMFLTR